MSKARLYFDGDNTGIEKNARAYSLTQEVENKLDSIDGIESTLQGEIDDLQSQINNLASRGRYLSTWDAETGLPVTNPPVSPYTYRAGDYFIVSNLGTVNYRPTGSSYTTGVASQVVEAETLHLNDLYIYDGSVWLKQGSSAGTSVVWGTITGTLSDQIDLQNSLNNKANTSDVLTKTNTTSYTPTANYHPATKKYVDDASVTFKAFPNTFNTTGTTAQFLSSISALNLPVGSAYLGQVSLSDMPTGITVQGDVEVYVYPQNVIYAVMRSVEVEPYEWVVDSYSNYYYNKSWMPTANYVCASTAPSSHDEGMLWYDTTNNILKVWNGTSWDVIDTNTTYSTATSSALGLVKLASDTVQSEAAQTVSSTVGRTYGVQLNSSNQMVVNVPREDTTYSRQTPASGGTTLSLVNTGDMYTWDNKQDALATQTAYTSQGDATKVPQITTNSLGQVTGITEVTITQPDISGKQDKATSGSTAPSSTPSYVGQQYVDTTNDKLYFATGTSSSSDWEECGSGSGTGDVSGPSSSTDGDVVLFDGVTGKLVKDSGRALPTNTSDLNNDSGYITSASLPGTATSSTSGTVKLASDTAQTESAQTVSSTAGRTYGVQLNSSNQMVVNVPWTDTTYTASDFDIKDLTDSTSLRSTWSGKQDALVNQTNIKSINGTSLLGSGDITTPNTTYTASDFDIKDLTDSTSLRSTWSGKQDALVSGTNIKTINGTTILGSGDIVTPNTTYTASDFDIKDLTDSTSLRSTWSGKQDELIAGTNISIANDGRTISSTDTTYSNGTYLTLNGTTFDVDTSLIATKTDLANFAGFEVVQTLPVSDIKTNIIYLKGPIGTGVDKYEEWIYSNTTWIQIGETSVDLTNYLNTSTQTSDAITEGTTNLFLTSAERTILGNTSGTNTGDQTASDFDIKDLTDSLGKRAAWDAKMDNLVFLSYGTSTWADFAAAYGKNVYCRASSNSNPAQGDQTRCAFMAYINNPDISTATEVEFQYYRSVATHSDATQGDEVFVYKLNKNTGRTVTKRNAYSKIAAGSGLGSSYSSGTLTLTANSQVSDTAYAASWDGVTDTAPSKNAVYDKISAMDTTIGSKVTGPNSSTDGHLAVFDGATGKVIKDGGAVPTGVPSGGTNGQVLTQTANGPAWQNAGGGQSYTAGTGISILNGDDYSAMKGPASVGYHIPSKTEWETIIGIFDNSFQLSANSDTFGQYLNMPLVGLRGYQYSAPMGRGIWACYWTCDAYDTSNAYYLYFESSTAAVQNSYRSDAYSIRCFKDEPVVPDIDSGWTGIFTSYTLPEGNGIYTNTTLGLISISVDGTNWITIQDKNLGATTVYQYGGGESDANCGYYYQWGNCYGFTFNGSYPVTSSTVDVTGYGPGNYYESSNWISTNPWQSNASNGNDLWGGVTGVVQLNNAITNIGVLSVNGQSGAVTGLLTAETVVSGDSGVTYTIKTSNSDPASGTPATTITFVL